MTSTILAAADFTVMGGNAALSVISIVLGLAALGAGIFVAVDANKYSDQAHQAAGAPKMLWLVGGPLVGFISCACCAFLGLIIPILWFAVYKKKVEAAQGGGFAFGGPQPYGGPPPGGPPPGGFGTPPPPPGGGFPPPPPSGPPGGGFPPPPPSGPPGGGFPPPPSQ